MSAIGAHWNPVLHVLEKHFEFVLANAQQIGNVRGCTTDVNDARWIAALLARGLIHSTFVPLAQIQQLCDLARTREQCVRRIDRHSLRIQKGLETANIKVASVSSDVLCVSGRAMPAASIAGEHDPERLADVV